jgi:phosphoribosyl 1,2-cyclic phosphate phosphodiesterase
MRLVILGSGTSCGVPQIGCDCSVCKSEDPLDKRLRSSALVETDDMRVLIDCGPDFRQQMLTRPAFKKIDAVLITHSHYDHVGGLDDLRPFCTFGDIPIYSDALTAYGIRRIIPYCFEEHKYPGVPNLTSKVIEPFKSFILGDMKITPIRVMHGKLPILGYRINNFAYITDMKTIPDISLSYLEGIDILVVNALRHNTYKDHPTHQTVEDAIEFSKRIEAKRTVLIHMSHHLGLHRMENSILPKGIELAYDGFEMQI